MFELGKEIDFYGMRRKKQIKKLLIPAILDLIAAAYLIFVLTL